MAAMTQAEVDALVARIKRNLPGLRRGIDEKDPVALDVYRYYDMVARCPEHGAMVLCEGALDRWEKRRATASEGNAAAARPAVDAARSPSAGEE
jgi:hypothetical protein